MFDVTGLTKVGDYAEAVYTVRNDSNGICAEITLNLTNSNSEYFKVTETIFDNKLQAGEETTAKIRVEMIKTPIESTISTNIVAKIKSNPIENNQALLGESIEEVHPKPYLYSISKTFKYYNSQLSEEEITYTNYNDAKMAFNNKPVASAIITKNGLIDELYAVFEMNNSLYYLRGAEMYNSEQQGKIFIKNVEVLKSAYGPNWDNYCHIDENDDYTDFCCDMNGLNACARSTGWVYAQDSNTRGGCAVDWGYVYCFSW